MDRVERAMKGKQPEMESSGSSSTSDSDLLDLVFSWSLEDILNDNLYKDKVELIPESFQSVSEFSGSFLYPLLEETRSNLCSSIEFISRAPYAKVSSFVEVSSPESTSYNAGLPFYDIEVNEWRNRLIDRGRVTYKMMPGDFFAIVKSRPENFRDLRAVAKTWVYAYVTSVSHERVGDEVVGVMDGETSSSIFRVKASKNIDLVDVKYTVVFLMNITSHKRIWDSLHMSENLNLIRRVLQRNSQDEGSCSFRCVEAMSPNVSENLHNEVFSRLNPSQYKVILASLQGMQCEHQLPVQLVWGPPGTGKTKTMATLLNFLLMMTYRTLACAPTIIAIKDIARRVLETRKNSNLGSILLFGSKLHPTLTSDVEGIYLNYRVKRLAECFAPLTGWTVCFPVLLNLLEDCVLLHSIFLENELCAPRELRSDAARTRKMESFLVFLRSHFKAAAQPVRQCISIFCTHVSGSYIGEHNLERMKYLFDLLDCFGKLLFHEDVDSGALLKLFFTGEVEGVDDRLQLLDVNRRECISVLRNLHQSLVALNLPCSSNDKILTELCFQMASLILCTTSSSFALHSMPMQPLSLLVIDEATQLKECESVIPLQLPGLTHAILFGDEQQLPAVVGSKISGDAGFGRSLFQRLSLLGWPRHLLNVQYRMHPSISAFPNAKFYQNQILDAPNVEHSSYGKCYVQGPIYGPYSFINIFEGNEELDDDDDLGRRNTVEAAVAAKILHNVYRSWRRSSRKLSVGVISPYAAQVVAIKEMLGRRYEAVANFEVKLNTVDGFQGREEDIIILSTVRSNTVGFISNPQHTNLALTRARHCLWILGHERTLANSDSIWKALISDAKERHCFFNADEEKSLAQTIIDVKKDLDQLDDLLNKDSALFRSARWKVQFSENFVKRFSNLPSKRTKKSVMSFLVKLSNGWRPKKFNADLVCESSLQVVKQYKVEGLYVICTKDIVKESMYIQVMKIWDIVPLEDVPKWVTRLENIYAACSDDYLRRCKENCVEGSFEVPMSWSTSLDIVRFRKPDCTESVSVSDGESDDVAYVENAKVNESLLLMKFYSLSAGTVSHLISGADGKALDLPFEVTHEEMQIIQHRGSTFLLGRSGTGKTTVLTMKLFQNEQLYQMGLEGLGNGIQGATCTNIDNSDVIGDRGMVLRQLFVTVSPRLCYAIKQHISNLKSFASSESSSMVGGIFGIQERYDGDQFSDLPNSFVGISPKSYPLVITFNKFLLMLDGTLGSSYFERFHYDTKLSDGGSNISRSAAFLMKRNQVDFEKFSIAYWPHFNSQLTKKLDASVVFTEIISSIKGGLHVGEFDDGKLSREGYLHLSDSRTSTLKLQERDMIYQLFLYYEKMKIERREFDMADLVNDLHCRLSHSSYDGDNIDFVYIDEVQDLTIRQIALFKYICKNVSEGFVFSGDTAQTIARGIDFRFEDIRCLFFKEFVAPERVQMSPTFHLRQNFRTHAGILNLGQSVIDLIYHFFPHLIDKLPAETSLIFGEAPILLESDSDEDPLVTIFGSSKNGSGDRVGFGAEQVILVRDDFERIEISKYVGSQALLLTIVECKGLEFQDVLLYNFFGSSPAKNQWRVVYEFMKAHNILDSTLPHSFPDFVSSKHHILCSELKQLYVAITRTRQRLWICENEKDLSKPMFDYWKKKCFVQVRELDDSLARELHVASTPEEWKERGLKLLAVENYEVAAMCFERAGECRLQKYAGAVGMETSAHRIRDLNPDLASKHLQRAAELFESINECQKAADCYCELKEYEKAGRIYCKLQGEPMLKRAGECFTLAGCYELAAHVYAEGNMYAECLSSCTRGKLYDVGLQCIQRWRQQAAMHPPMVKENFNMIVQEFLERCAISYLKLDDKIAMMRFIEAFSSEHSRHTFMKKWGCLDELTTLEEELGNFSHAIDIARGTDDSLLEAERLLKAGFYKEACTIYLWYALASCLWATGSAGWPLKPSPQNLELLLKAKECADNMEPCLLKKTALTDILLLLNREHSLSELKDFFVMSQSLQHLRGKMLSIRRILDVMLQTSLSNHDQGNEFVKDLSEHCLHCISQNRVSVETLIYFWNIWKENILAIFKFLDTVGTTDDEVSEHGEFCLNYLGVRRQSYKMSQAYFCIYPDSAWVREIGKGFVQDIGKFVRIDTKPFLAAARNHWSAEMFSTAMKVLDALEAFRKNTRIPLSAATQARILTQAYDFAQNLNSCNYSPKGSQDSKSLQKCICNLQDAFLGYVFPVDWRISVTKDMISLRERDISARILKDLILKNVKGKGNLTYGQLGRVVMALLGSRNCLTDFCKTISRRVGKDSPWGTFFGTCSSSKRLKSKSTENLVGDALQRWVDSMAYKLSTALDGVDDGFRRLERDYISPGCFAYLAERLLVSCVEFRDMLLVTRSSLVEWLINHEWAFPPTITVASITEAFKDVCCFVGHIVYQLLRNKRETLLWFKRGVGINAKDHFPLLLLRLVVLLSIICLNSGSCWTFLQEVLNSTEIMAELPPPFSRALRGREEGSPLNADSLAKALWSIEDPLIIVKTRDNVGLFCQDAISLDVADRSRDEVLRILFPDKFCANQPGLTVINDPGKLNYQSSKASADLEKQPFTLNAVLKDWICLEGFEAFDLLEKKDGLSKQNLLSNSPKLKGQAEKAHELMKLVVALLSESNTCDDGCENDVAKADSLLLQLQLYSVVLNARGQQLEDSLPLIKDISKRLLAAKPDFDRFLCKVIDNIDKVSYAEADVTEGSGDDSEADNEGDNLNEAHDDSLPDAGPAPATVSATAPSPSPAPAPASETRDGNRKKGNKKSNRGKQKKGGRRK